MADKVADLLADLPPVLPSSGPKWQFTFLLLEFILADQLADLPPQYWHLVIKNGNFTFLLLRVHIGRSHGRSTPLMQYIMGCLLWDVIGSHCGFFKKRQELAFISK